MDEICLTGSNVFLCTFFIYLIFYILRWYSILLLIRIIMLKHTFFFTQWLLSTQNNCIECSTKSTSTVLIHISFSREKVIYFTKSSWNTFQQLTIIHIRFENVIINQNCELRLLLNMNINKNKIMANTNRKHFYQMF